VSASPRTLFRIGVATMLLLAAASPLASQTAQSTAGSIARYDVPSGWQHRYDETADTVVLLDPGFTQVVLFVWGPGDTALAVTSLLSALGGDAYAGQVRPVTLNGVRGSEVRIDAGGGSEDWIVALPVDGLLLGIWGKTARGLQDLETRVRALLSTLELAPRAYPSLVVGTYQTESDSSTDWTGDGLFYPEYVTLHPDGSAERATNVGGQVGDVGVSGAGSDGGVRWEVRGNRLLFHGGGEYANFGVQAFRNGLELYDQEGGRLLWVRQ